MMNKIKPRHTERKAVLYVRQSTSHQVLHNEESRRLQYAMEHRLRELGWTDVEVIDDDLGLTAAGTVARGGFERMVSQVCLGKVGAVAAREVSRFARNSQDWQKLVEVCRLVDALLIDQETVYDPRFGNDRLLLGLKGSLNEYELDLLRQRSLEARYEKARRGEFIPAFPIGFQKNAEGSLEKDPDLRVQESILLVFRKFFEFGSARQTLLWFIEHDLKLPVRRPNGDLAWVRPRYPSVYSILTNPAYGGAYAFGKTETLVLFEDGLRRKVVRRKPKDQWLSLIPESHEGYVTWDEFQSVQEVLAANRNQGSGLGAPKNGSALLPGLLLCRRCGRRFTTTYTGRPSKVPRYACHRGMLDSGESKCISFGATSVDEAIGREIMRVVSPSAIRIAVLASREEHKQQDEVLEALRRDLLAAQYSADRAWRQYNASDPENRLVTGELERRWNCALEVVHTLESRIKDHVTPRQNSIPATVEEFQDLAADLETVWNDSNSDVRLKKRIVRTLIQEIACDVDADAGEVILVIHWKGGVHTELRLPRRRRGYNPKHTSDDAVSAVRSLSRICSDKTIAGVLNRNGLRTGRGNRWTQERVASLRKRRGIKQYSEEVANRDGWMNLTQASQFLGVASRTLRLAVERGEIVGEHPLSDGPWVLKRLDLQCETAKKFVRRVQNRNLCGAVPDPQQKKLNF